MGLGTEERQAYVDHIGCCGENRRWGREGRGGGRRPVRKLVQ